MLSILPPRKDDGGNKIEKKLREEKGTEDGRCKKHKRNKTRKEDESNDQKTRTGCRSFYCPRIQHECILPRLCLSVHSAKNSFSAL